MHCNCCDYLVPPGASRPGWLPNLHPHGFYFLRTEDWRLEVTLPADGQLRLRLRRPALRRLLPPTKLPSLL